MRRVLLVFGLVIALLSCQNQIVHDFKFFKEDVEDLEEVDLLFAKEFEVFQVIDNSSALAQEVGGTGRIVLMYDVDRESIFYDRQVIGAGSSQRTYFYHIGTCKYNSSREIEMTIPIIYMSSTMITLYSVN